MSASVQGTNPKRRCPHLFFSFCVTIENQFYFHFAGCCGTFCGLCLVCQNANGMQKSGILYGLLTCIMPCIPILLLRQEARDKYQIEVTFH